MFIFCKVMQMSAMKALQIANELILCKDNKKDDTMRDTNVKMWMKFSFSDRRCI